MTLATTGLLKRPPDGYERYVERSMKSLSIVIPALNEEGVVGNTIRTIPLSKLEKLGLEVEILVVDNASEDNTANEVREAVSKVDIMVDKGSSRGVNIRWTYSRSPVSFQSTTRRS